MAYDTSAYDELLRQYNQSVDADTQAQIKRAQDQANSQLRNAYVQRVQNQRQLNDRLAMAGIRGGATETSNLRLQNQYGQQVGQINTNLGTSVNDINRAANQQKLAYAQELNTKRQQYVENREAEDRANAREDEQRARQERLEYLTAEAATQYDIKKIQNKIKEAVANNDYLAIQVLNARLGFLRSQKHGY